MQVQLRRILTACILIVFAGTVAFAAAKPGNKESLDPLAVAYECLGALAEHAQGSADALPKAVSAGEKLLTMTSQDAEGRTGWSYTQEQTTMSEKCGAIGALDAFGDGTCNPPGTPYMIQTGYAIAGLAQLYLATGEGKFLAAATKAAKDSWDVGTAPRGCPSCYYYWYSYHPHDFGRYVRNTNLIMALGVAWLYAATGDASYKARVLAVAVAERNELKQGNYGYFGVEDPRYKQKPAFESQRIENHSGHQVKALKDIAIILDRPDLLQDAAELLAAFMNCKNERCRPGNCASWGAPPSCKSTWTISPCILGEVDGAFRTQCGLARTAIPQYNNFQKFLTTPTEAIKSLCTQQVHKRTLRK